MRNIYENNKSFVDQWLKDYQIESWAKREKKFEWQAGNKYNSIKDIFIQLRQSGIRCRKPITFPALVAMAQIPIIYDKEIEKFRYLTPRECARLQSFPEEFIIAENDRDGYKQFGNSINVECAKYAIKELLKISNHE